MNQSARRTVGIAVTVAVAMAIGAWVFGSLYGWKSGAGNSRTDLTIAPPDASENWRAAEVPVALVGDYYEHTIEHTPPRDPSGAMQRRERFYRAPADPLDLLQRKLTTSSADRALRDAVSEWFEKWQAGQMNRPERPDIARLRQQMGGRLPPGLPPGQHAGEHRRAGRSVRSIRTVIRRGITAWRTISKASPLSGPISRFAWRGGIRPGRSSWSGH